MQVDGTTKVNTLKLIVGPMGAGKTTLLVKQARSARMAVDRTVMMLTPYNGCEDQKALITTHDGEEERAIVLDTPGKDLHSVLGVDNNTDMFFDEGQFLPFGWLDWVRIMLEGGPGVPQGVRIVVAGLSGDFERKVWPVMSHLYPLASLVTTLMARCTVCGSDAPFTKRVVQGAERVVVGGMDKYSPRCAVCFAV